MGLLLMVCAICLSSLFVCDRVKVFFLFNFSMSRYSMYLERKLKTDHR